MFYQTNTMTKMPQEGLLAALQQSGADKTRYFSLLNDSDDFLRVINVPSKANISFEVEGLYFNACHYRSEEKSKLILWSTLGYLPYSVTAPQKRNALITILESTKKLPTVVSELIQK